MSQLDLNNEGQRSQYVVDLSSGDDSTEPLTGLEEPLDEESEPIARRQTIHKISHIAAWLLMLGLLASPFIGGYGMYTGTKGKVLGTATEAVQELNNAKPKLLALDIQGAHVNLASAYAGFQDVNQLFTDFGGILEEVAPLIPVAKSYYHLAKTGLYVTEAGTSITSSLSTLENASLIEKLENLYFTLEGARPSLLKAHAHAEKIVLEDLPAERTEEIASFLEVLDVLSTQMDPTIESLEMLLTLLGRNEWQRYLVLFQNSGELRPTGGFIGSLAIVDIEDGAVKKFTVPLGGSYDVNGGLQDPFVSPTPFHVLNPTWYMQDCNWFPDFAVSAKQCAWFVEEGMGTSVDGVFAINVDFVIDLLRRLGPVELPEYEVTVSHDNFITLTQLSAEGTREEGRPKEFLGVLFPVLLERLMEEIGETHVLVGFAGFMLSSFERGDVQVYHTDPTIQSLFEKHSLAGRIQEKEGYLHVNAATLNGGKSDFAIHQEIEYDIHTSTDGDVATVRIQRTHTETRIPETTPITKGERDLNYLIAQPNLSYIRVYTPKGSKLLQVAGDVEDVTELVRDVPVGMGTSELLKEFELQPQRSLFSNTRITEEFGKTVFGNYLLVNPGETKEIIFTYSIPHEHTGQVFIQKQSGIRSDLTVHYDTELIFAGMLEKNIEIGIQP